MCGESAAATAQRAVRLLVLAGLAVAAYFALSMFDHAARADDTPTVPLSTTKAGSTATLSNASIGPTARLSNARLAATGKKPASQGAKSRSASTVSDRKPERLKPQRKVASLKSDHKGTSLKADGRAALPKPNHKAALPNSNHKAAVPKPDHKAAPPKPNHKAALVEPERRKAASPNRAAHLASRATLPQQATRLQVAARKVAPLKSTHHKVAVPADQPLKLTLHQAVRPGSAAPEAMRLKGAARELVRMMDAVPKAEGLLDASDKAEQLQNAVIEAEWLTGAIPAVEERTAPLVKTRAASVTLRKALDGHFPTTLVKLREALDGQLSTTVAALRKTGDDKAAAAMWTAAVERVDRLVEPARHDITPWTAHASVDRTIERLNRSPIVETRDALLRSVAARLPSAGLPIGRMDPPALTSPATRSPVQPHTPATDSSPTIFGPLSSDGLAAQEHLRIGLKPTPGTPRAPRTPAPGSSAGAGHVRDAGGGTAPPMGTVPSSWWPEATTAPAAPPSNASPFGRTVRYCGPPS